MISIKNGIGTSLERTALFLWLNRAPYINVFNSSTEHHLVYRYVCLARVSGDFVFVIGECIYSTQNDPISA